MSRIMTHKEYKDICLSIKNDLSFEEFKILSSTYNYSNEYIESIWNLYKNKPLEFVLYHELGKELFSFLTNSKKMIQMSYLP